MSQHPPVSVPIPHANSPAPEIEAQPRSRTAGIVRVGQNATIPAKRVSEASKVDKPKEETSGESQDDLVQSAVKESLGRLVEHLNRLDQTLAKVIGIRAEQLAALQHLAVDLAVDIASTIIGREIQQGFDFSKIVQSATSDLNVEEIIIRLNPRDAELVDWQQFTHLQVKEDTTLRPGDCVIEAEDLTLERSWQEQLDRIQSNLHEGLGDART